MLARPLSFGLLLALALSTPAHADLRRYFDGDLKKLLEQAPDVVIAKGLPNPGNPHNFFDGPPVFDVDVTVVLKGDRKPGKLKIAADSRIQADKQYLLINEGGARSGADFVCLMPITVIALPENFDPADVKRNLKTGVEKILARQLHDLEGQLAPLLAQQALLESALKNRTDNVFESDGPLDIKTIEKMTCEVSGSSRYLNLGTAKLEWSLGSVRGQSGYLYYNGPPPDRKAWEFCPVKQTTLEEFDGQPLKVSFFNSDSPGIHGNSLTVTSGQIMLARTEDEPNTIYLIKFESVAEGELVTVRYAIHRQGK